MFPAWRHMARRLLPLAAGSAGGLVAGLALVSRTTTTTQVTRVPSVVWNKKKKLDPNGRAVYSRSLPVQRTRRVLAWEGGLHYCGDVEGDYACTLEGCMDPGTAVCIADDISSTLLRRETVRRHKCHTT
eukprot:6586415-Pyramimonas_sp.AAC.1